MSHATNTAIIKSSHDYYRKRIGAARSDSSMCWSVIRDVLHQTERHKNNTNAAHFHTRALSHIRKCVPENVAMSVATSMISARHDYCNSIL